MLFCEDASSVNVCKTNAEIFSSFVYILMLRCFLLLLLPTLSLSDFHRRWRSSPHLFFLISSVSLDSLYFENFYYYVSIVFFFFSFVFLKCFIQLKLRLKQKTAVWQNFHFSIEFSKNLVHGHYSNAAEEHKESRVFLSLKS